MHIWTQHRTEAGLINSGGPFRPCCWITMTWWHLSHSVFRVFEGLHNRVPISPHLEVPHARHPITNSAHMSKADTIPAIQACHSAGIYAILRC